MDSFEYLLAKLKVDGKEIGMQAKQGNALAQEVINAYQFWCKCPGDSVAFTLCEEAYNKWKKIGREGLQ